MLDCILEFIRLKKRTTIDELCRYFDVSTLQLDSILLMFELKGWIVMEQASGCNQCAQRCAHQQIIVAQNL